MSIEQLPVPHPTFTDRNGDLWYRWKDTAVKPFVADMYSDMKRLTDAELAAEFEAARCDYLLSESTGHFWAPLGETWPSDHESAGRRSSTLLRFATRDHYDEEPS